MNTDAALVPLRFPEQTMGPSEQRAYANGKEQERKDILACIRASSWSCSEEIVAMIKRRST